jgi:cell wall-associated NlpC family hydrolase
VTALLLAPMVCVAQESNRSARDSDHPRRAAGVHRTQRTLTVDDGLGVISAALDPKVRHFAGNDCSHMVQAIYQRAGFPYAYATSDDLYEGVEGFLLVLHPQPGDLIVWHGHAGIVVRPSHHVFFSFTSRGPGVDHYDSGYWAGRGIPRFYRYIKNHPCPGCAVNAAARREREE